MKKKGTRRTYTKQITHPYIFVSRNALLCLELVVKGRTYNKIIVCCSFKNKETRNNCMSLVQEKRCRDGLSAWCRFFLFPSFPSFS